VLAASRAAWRAKVRARKHRRFAYALAASLAVACGVIATFATLQRATALPAATLVIVNGDVALFSARNGAWEPLSHPDTPVFPGTRLRTGADGRAALTILGESSLRIASETEVSLNGPDALELVSGTLYIDSGDRAPANPLEITTPFGVVRDIGTQFEVRATPRALRVRVRTGSVLLMESLHPADVRSTAGDELEISASGTLELRDIAPDDEEWAWAMTLAVVPEIGSQSISEYLRWIAHEMGKSLRFESSATELRAQLERWSGDARGLTPSQVLDSIVATSDFVYEFTDDGTMLIRRTQAGR
jgi:ferric-dicitrate binding protein FerR (iron transport regulator)